MDDRLQINSVQRSSNQTQLPSVKIHRYTQAKTQTLSTDKMITESINIQHQHNSKQRHYEQLNTATNQTIRVVSANHCVSTELIN